MITTIRTKLTKDNYSMVRYGNVVTIYSKDGYVASQTVHDRQSDAKREMNETIRFKQE